MTADESLNEQDIKRDIEKERARQARKRFLIGRYAVAAVIILMLTFGLGAKYSVYVNGLPAEAVDMPGIVAVADFAASAGDGNIIVAVSGEVANKGYFSITPEITMRDLMAFTGMVRDSDVSAIDFTHIPQHGDVYYVRSAADPLDVEPWLTNELQTQTAEVAEEVPAADLVNLNTAGMAELMQLPSIGEVRAQAIIDYRIEHNGFSYKEELLGVKGIGSKIYEDIIDQITV